MTGNGRRFDPSELQDRGSAPMDEAEAAVMLDVARTLETFAAADGVTPSVGFEDRVMGAIALEPAPGRRAGGILAGLVLAVRDAWRVTWSGDRPVAVRAQALALVLLVVVAVGSLGTLTAVGVATFLGEDRAVPPTVQPDDGPPIAAPTPTPAVAEPTPAVPTGSLPPSSSPEATEEPGGSEEPSETPEATDDGGAGGTADPGGTPRPTAKPTHTTSPTPDPTETAEPDDTPDPSETPDPTSTPKPTSTPRPTPTPSPTGSSDSVDPAG